MTLRITKPLEQFSWQPQPRAQQLVHDLLAQFLSRSPQTAQLGERMRNETGTRLVDWIDHFAFPGTADLEQQLKSAGFTETSFPGAQHAFVQNQGIFPVILLTDGQDQGSQLRLRDAVEAAQKSDSICYVLLLADRDIYGGTYYGSGDMNKLAKETGGRMIEIGNKVDKLKDAFDQISRELRSQYSLGFKPDDIADGKTHKIVVKVDVDGDGQYDDKAYVVKAREVYNAPKPEAAAGTKTGGGKQ